MQRLRRAQQASQNQMNQRDHYKQWSVYRVRLGVLHTHPLVF
jgi:hypothetical protein